MSPLSLSGNEVFDDYVGHILSKMIIKATNPLNSAADLPLAVCPVSLFMINCSHING